MPQSLAQIYVHLVFSTKNRFPWLRRDALREELFGYLVGGCVNLQCPSQRIGGYHDHIHILCSLGRTTCVADLVRELKKSSSEWLKEQDSDLRDFHWQAGYGAFSVSPAHVAALIEYIKNQPEHHRQESYQDEFRRLCAKSVWTLTNATYGTDRSLVPGIAPRWGARMEKNMLLTQGAPEDRRPWAKECDPFGVDENGHAVPAKCNIQNRKRRNARCQIGTFPRWRFGLVASRRAKIRMAGAKTIHGLGESQWKSAPCQRRLT